MTDSASNPNIQAIDKMGDLLDGVDRHRVLIVEHMPLQAEQLRRDLESFAYEVECVSTGAAALDILRLKPTRYALVLTAVNLPDLDGHRLLRAVRSEKPLERLPVIFLSFFQDAKVSEAAFHLGAIDILGKPYRMEELKVRVNNMIALSEYEKLLHVEQAVLSSELMMKNYELEQKNARLQDANVKLKELQAELLIAAKVASLGVLSSGLAHEINGPLTSIKVQADQIEDLLKRRPLDEDELHRTADRLRTAVGRVERVAGNLQILAAGGKASDFDGETKVDEMISRLQVSFVEMARSQSVEVEYNLQAEDAVCAVPVPAVRQVLLGIIYNAIDAMESVSERKLTISSLVGGKFILIEVADTGHGIPEASLKRIFEPFFTTKEPGKGMGLGLSIAYRFVKECGGDIVCRSEISGPNRGTRFVISLPLAQGKSV